MLDSDFDAFSDLLDATCGLLSRGAYRPNATNTALWFRAVAEHDLDTVRAGFDAHVRDTDRGRFVPNPADVLGQIERLQPRIAHPAGDEAWSLAIAASDESRTVVWTDLMAEALTVAQPVLDAGDKVGARMAFKAAYDRSVEQARQAGRAPVWHVSMGWDQEGRHKAISAAVERGLLPRTTLASLPAPEPRGEPLLRLVAPAQADSQVAIDAKTKLRAMANDMRGVSMKHVRR